MTIAVLARGTDYEVFIPYNKSFVHELKIAVPYIARKYNANNRSWMVAGDYGNVIVQLITKHFNRSVQLPAVDPAETITSILEILYIGQAKQRNDGSITATGWHNDGWNVAFPINVLRGYFESNLSKNRPSDATLYTSLGISKQASLDEVKAGYRRMVKQWHPDVCREPDAVNVFHQIQHAWEILSNAKKRARYDAGLTLEATLEESQRTKKSVSDDGYRAPLRSGLLLASYTERVGAKTINKIHDWKDITNDLGQTLVSSWVMGEDAPRVEWV